MAVAKAIEAHKNCVKVIYPGLKSHPQYALAQRQMKGPGAMISFYVKGGIEVTTHFLTNLKLFTLAESLGGVESLAEAPSVMTHGSVPPEVRKALGIEDNFIRLSVGIEDEKDLVADVVQALDRL
jgi:cystathionine gamma-lyase